MIVFALRTDLLNGFSDDEVCYGEGEDGEEGETGLDLFAAMLDSGAGEKQGKTKRKRSIVRERHGSEGSKRRKLVENTKEDSSETAEPANEEMNIMRGTGVSKLTAKIQIAC